ncbi:unnamed protein product [Meloidogyne enterolobii]|uniref:Uncharacterized protein n=1 Tax=Meloidogyne enterolobii TaxID=390850 RepID=A0ACB0ZIG8_MELEN
MSLVLEKGRNWLKIFTIKEMKLFLAQRNSSRINGHSCRDYIGF